MNMKVMFHDNREGVIDSRMLDEMVSADNIKMFMRSGCWAIVGISPMRGSGGLYDSVEKRGEFGTMNHAE